MKAIKYFLILMLINGSMSVLEAKDECYCSDKCGPRPYGARKGDNPKLDAESGQCFCQQRDKDNYDTKKHAGFGGVTCKVKEETSPSNFVSYCDKHKN